MMLTYARKLQSIRAEISAREDVIILTVVFGIFASVLIGANWWYEQWRSQVTSTKHVGELVAVHFAGDATVVTTSSGAFRVVGSFQGFNGNPLAIETYRGAPSALCDAILGFCRPLSY